MWLGWDYDGTVQLQRGQWGPTRKAGGPRVAVYALERGAGGLGLLGATNAAVCYPGGESASVHLQTSPASCYSPTGTAVAVAAAAAATNLHHQHQALGEQQTPMTPTSAPAAVAASPNNPVAMSQLGTVYATKRRRRNGKR